MNVLPQRNYKHSCDILTCITQLRSRYASTLRSALCYVYANNVCTLLPSVLKKYCIMLEKYTRNYLHVLIIASCLSLNCISLTENPACINARCVLSYYQGRLTEKGNGEATLQMPMSHIKAREACTLRGSGDQWRSHTRASLSTGLRNQGLRLGNSTQTETIQFTKIIPASNSQVKGKLTPISYSCKMGVTT